MGTYRKALYFSLLLALVAVAGCARAARDTTGFSVTDTAVINAPLEPAWQATKAVLREMEMDIYTRDKRGAFVAYSGVRRRMLVPHRIRYQISLEQESDAATRLTIETTRQVYGVTLLTYPDWHDRKTTDNSEALQVIESVKARLP